MAEQMFYKIVTENCISKMAPSENPDNSQDKNRKIAAETLKKLDEVKNFIEVNGSDHLNMIFNELIENVEQMKLKNQNAK